MAYACMLFLHNFSPSEPLQVSKCEKCGKVLAELKELLRIVKENTPKR
jgi:hypothetical protein